MQVNNVRATGALLAAQVSALPPDEAGLFTFTAKAAFRTAAGGSPTTGHGMLKRAAERAARALRRGEPWAVDLGTLYRWLILDFEKHYPAREYAPTVAQVCLR